LQTSADAPLYEWANYVRVVDERGELVADLRYGEHAVVALGAGEHMFVAYNWSTAPGMSYGPDRVPPLVANDDLWRRKVAGGVAVLRGSFEEGRVYPLRIIATISRGPCASLELTRVDRAELASFERWLDASDRVETLGEARERSGLVDNAGHVTTLLAWGRWRMANDARWEATRSTIRAEDGVERIEVR
jgi:hypothetical protein